MKTIFKYDIEVKDDITVMLPQWAKVLSVQVQDDKPKIWALVDTAMALEERRFKLYGTGHPISAYDTDGTFKFVGTFQLRGGQLVFHLFEV